MARFSVECVLLYVKRDFDTKAIIFFCFRMKMEWNWSKTNDCFCWYMGFCLSASFVLGCYTRYYKRLSIIVTKSFPKFIFVLRCSFNIRFEEMWHTLIQFTSSCSVSSIFYSICFHTSLGTNIHSRPEFCSFVDNIPHFELMYKHVSHTKTFL